MANDLAKSIATRARLSLGRAAAAASTDDHLQFQLDHALARDAVHARMDVAMLARGLEERGLETVAVRSAVESSHADRRSYLRRPDLGRKLAIASVEALKSGMRCVRVDGREKSQLAKPRIVFVLADGLSARAIEHHALPLLDATLPLIPGADRLVPIAIDARVAIGDEIGEWLEADLTVVLIGERPGLSSADSLGAYMTWKPRLGRTDAERNCISNIRGEEGLGYAEAARRIAYYAAEASRLETTGIALKDPAQTLKLDV